MTDAKRSLFFVACIMLLACSWATARQATITGSVLDNETLAPLEGIEVSIVPVDAAGPVIAAYTNVSGAYSAKVAPGDYEVSIKKLGGVGIKKTLTAEGGKTEAVDFLVGIRNTAKDASKKQDDGIVLWAAAAIFLIAAAAYYVLHKKKKSVEASQPAEDSRKVIPVVASDQLSLLKAERDRLKRMMAEERDAYNKRKINEERLKAVISDHERSLAEVKRKIAELEAE